MSNAWKSSCKLLGDFSGQRCGQCRPDCLWLRKAPNVVIATEMKCSCVSSISRAHLPFFCISCGGRHYLLLQWNETDETDEIVSRLDDMLSRSCRLQPGLGKFLILLACFGACRVNHLLRSLDFKDGASLAAQYSAPFRRSVDDLLRSTTTDEKYTLACMASRRGGLVLKNPIWTHGSLLLYIRLLHRFGVSILLEATFIGWKRSTFRIQTARGFVGRVLAFWFEP